MPYKLFDPRTWFQFRGCVSRTNFWIFYLGAMVVFFLAQQCLVWLSVLVPGLTFGLILLAGAMVVGFCLAAAGAMARRLRDAGRKIWSVYLCMTLPLCISGVFMADVLHYRLDGSHPTPEVPGFFPYIIILALIWILSSVWLLTGLMRPTKSTNTAAT
jgi:uncharacterized membrane protein YhaH (DUF805 family)